MRFKIAIVAPRNAQMLDIFGPLDVFKEANRLAPGDPAFEIDVVSIEPEGCLCSSGLNLSADWAVDVAPTSYDLTLVAGSPDQPSRSHNPVLSAWLNRLAGSGHRVGSVCTGAFILAQAGLLDGRNVTTHWADAAELARRFPKANVMSDRIFCRDGPIYTSAGVTAGIDLALSIVEEVRDRQVAMRVAKHLVVFLKRPGGQSQFSSYLLAQLSEQPRIRRLQEFILSDLTAEHTHADLAMEACMSERTLLREFRNATGTTPRRFVERARFDEARRLIEEGVLTLDAIAYRTGLKNGERMRRVFIRSIGINPSEYKARFFQSD